MTTASAIAVIGCIVGVITCVIGVATFTSARMAQAKNDGVMLAKIDQCVKNTEDLKKEAKENNHEINVTLDMHTKDIVQLQTNVQSIFKQLNELKRGE